MRLSSLIRALLVVLVASVALARPASAQVDIIRGQVIGPEGKPLEDAKITATSLSGNVNRSARTDKNGRYTITFPGGEGDYFVEAVKHSINQADHRMSLEMRRNAFGLRSSSGAGIGLGLGVL